MTVRLAALADLPDILSVYEIARAYMRSNKNPHQWGTVYPQRELLEQDIGSGYLWVIEEKFSKKSKAEIVGVFAFFPEGDPIYNNIEGKWLNDLPHGAIHRVASSGKCRGILGVCVSFCAKRSANLKIDTHSDNLIMQNALERQGFIRCGRIFLENGEDRIAYQRAD